MLYAIIRLNNKYTVVADWSVKRFENKGKKIDILCFSASRDAAQDIANKLNER